MVAFHYYMRQYRTIIAAKRLCPRHSSPFRLQTFNRSRRIQGIDRGISMSTRMSKNDATNGDRVWWKECVVYQVSFQITNLCVTGLLGFDIL
jgi:hypothetical protein